MSNKVILWAAIGVGLVLIYAAYKNQHLKDVISNVIKAPESK